MTAAKTLDLSIYGRSGLEQYSGYVYQEKHPRLRGPRGPKLYREMADNDAIIGAILFLIECWVSQAEWRIEPADEHNPDAVEWATFVEQCIEDMSHSWEDLVGEIMGMLVYGWAYFELCYKHRAGASKDPTRNSKYEDGRIGWRKIASRAQDTLLRWEFDEDGGIQGMWQLVPTGSEPYFIPIEKSLLFRTKNINNNPEGRSMLRNAVRSYGFLKRIQEIEATGIERDMSGYPVIEAPEDLFDPQASDAQKKMLAFLQTLVQDIRRDEREGAVIPCELNSEGKPTGYKLRLVSTGGQRAIAIGDVVKRYESRIAMTVLAEFIMLGMDKVGSFSAHSSKTDVFAIALGSMLDRISAVFNRFAIPRLCAYNGCPTELVPTLVHGDLAPPPLDEIAKYVSGLSSSGMLMYDKKLERKLREFAGLPEPEEDAVDTSDLHQDEEQAGGAIDGVEHAVQLDASGKPIKGMPQMGVLAGGTPAGAKATAGGAGTTGELAAMDQGAHDDETIPQSAAAALAGNAPLAHVTLTGPQLVSITALLTAVAQGELPRDAVVNLLCVAFPITPDQAEAILGSIGQGFEPKKPPAPPPAAMPFGRPPAGAPPPPPPGKDAPPPADDAPPAKGGK